MSDVYTQTRNVGQAPVGDHVANTALETVQTIPVEDGATDVLLQAVAQPVRVTIDGSTPTLSHGFLIAAGGFLPLPCKDVVAIKALETAAGAELQAQFLA